MSDMNVNGPHSAPLARRRSLLATLALLLFALGCGRKAKSEQQVVDLQIESDGDFLAFRPETLTCPAGALVHLTFHHTGRFISARHDWVLTHPGELEALTKDFSCQMIVSDVVGIAAEVDLSDFPGREISVRGRDAGLSVRVVAKAGMLASTASAAK